MKKPLRTYQTGKAHISKRERQRFDVARWFQNETSDETVLFKTASENHGGRGSPPHPRNHDEEHWNTVSPEEVRVSPNSIRNLITFTFISLQSGASVNANGHVFRDLKDCGFNLEHPGRSAKAHQRTNPSEEARHGNVEVRPGHRHG